MYSRNSVKGTRYSPPPGYAGNTVSDDGRLKHHLPSDELERREEVAKEPSCPHVQTSEATPKISEEKRIKPQERDIFEDIISALKGKFGSEELIILAVMLLIAQDGIGVEVLILALILIAG